MASSPQTRRPKLVARWGSACILAVIIFVTTALPASASTNVKVNWTRIGIFPRAAASMDSAKVRNALSDGDTVSVVCEGEGQPVSNGHQVISIWDQLSDGTWLPNAFLDTGSVSWTPGVPRCDGSSEGAETKTSERIAEPSNVDPCVYSYSGGRQISSDFFGGHRTIFDRRMSLYQVCSGFGAPADLEFSPAMKCALIAAAATFGGPQVSIPVNRACEAADIVEAFQSNDWLGYAGGKACGFFSNVFATAGGIAAGGAAAGTGPGAAAVGVTTYRALTASLKVVCGGLFDGGAYDLGQKLEADHETDIATDVLQKNKCIREDVRFGVTKWSATEC